MDEKEAIALLKKYSTDEEAFEKVLAHSRAVQKTAVRIAREIMDNGYLVDIDLVNTASLLHDIGRFECPPGTEKSIQHGVAGAEILIRENLPEHALIAARHLGAGITKEDIKEQDLPLADEDYVPETVEEKIVTYADNLIFGEREGTIEEVIERYKGEVGEKVAERVKKLHQEIEELKNS